MIKGQMAFGLVGLIGFTLPTLGCAPILDVSDNDGSTVWERKTVDFGPGDVVLIEGFAGERALVQFTRIAPGTSQYRWRYRGARSREPVAGVGEVVERYERKPGKDGAVFFLARPGNDTIVRAGKIHAEWVRNRGEHSAALSYYPRQAKITVLSPAAFDSAL
jgi:hypothetical protein